MISRNLRFAAILSVPVITLTACVSGGSGDGGDTGESGGGGEGSAGEGAPPTSTATSTYHGADLQLAVESLEKHDDEKVVLKMTISNNGSDPVEMLDILSYPSRMNGAMNAASGVSLIDTENFNRHRPLLYSEDDPECLCSTWSDVRELEAGDSLDFWVAYPAPPKDVTAMTVNTTITPDIMDVPITEAAEPDQEITSSKTAEEEILSMHSFEDQEEGSSREETGEETSVMLSSDVLFDLNESSLTSKADDELEKVAEEIDASTAETVEIDGYTDDSGDDSINIPLSEKRAESVEKRLEDLVEGSGITFETAGWGSEYPVADNGTDEGQEKNRRVTVTFDRGD